ncbi:MAG: hypothetical protein QXM08_07260 [Thermofilaceae archaeon]
MKVEVCDLWYVKKVVVPLEEKEVKCINRLPRRKKLVVVYYKKCPNKRSSILLGMVEKFGRPIGEHYWRGYSRGGRMLWPGVRRRKHVVYEVPDKVLELYEKVKEVASDRLVPWDLVDKCGTLEELEKAVDDLRREVLSSRRWVAKMARKALVEGDEWCQLMAKLLSFLSRKPNAKHCADIFLGRVDRGEAERRVLSALSRSLAKRMKVQLDDRESRDYLMHLRSEAREVIELIEENLEKFTSKAVAKEYLEKLKKKLMEIEAPLIAQSLGG